MYKLSPNFQNYNSSITDAYELSPQLVTTNHLRTNSLAKKTLPHHINIHHHHHRNLTVKDCGHHGNDWKKLYRRLFYALIGFIVVVLIIIFLIWLILRPTKPHFILQEATVYAFNLSFPNFLTTTLQITLSSRNTNGRIGVYYDKLAIYTSYHSQQITLATRLPPSYQGHKDITVWSPFLYGNAVPVAPYLAVSLNQDQMTGTVLINVRVDGRIRWKVGTFISGKYHLYVNCPAYINFANKNNAVNVGSGIKYQLITDCDVDV